MSNNQPHDRFVRHAFGYPELAIDFFRFFLGEVQQGIDLEKMTPEPDSEVAKTLDKTTTDVLFSAPFRDRSAYLYLLVEHKSEGAERGDGPSLPWQMHVQEVALMERHRRADEKGRLPLIICLGLYHGSRAYSGSRSVADEIDAPDPMIPDRWREAMHLIDLSAYSDEALANKGKLSVFLLLLKHIYKPRVARVYRELLPLLGELEKERNGAGFIRSILEYLIGTAPAEIQDEIVQSTLQSLSKETGVGAMTIAEAIKQEGIEEGVEKERSRRNFELVSRMKREGLDLTMIMRITDLTKEEIEDLEQGESGSEP